jgi:transcriptional regulator with XRE-family HTH domain
MGSLAFGSYLRRLRTTKDLTAIALSDLSGVSQPFISQIENNQRVPSPKMIRALSSALGVSHIGMMIKAGYITEDEVLATRKQNGIDDLGEGVLANA